MYHVEYGQGLQGLAYNPGLWLFVCGVWARLAESMCACPIPALLAGRFGREDVRCLDIELANPKCG
eukprot:scaffold61441_cov22-Tisochrysis_lutea.AAC.3